jgi:bifunctional UDP-N-acetylglucosamine pyrophosphorylase / glucosamine-1-phosphate N-acetyltransferase
MTVALIILAAGLGTRMKSDRPKVLHALAGAPLLHHAMAAAPALGADRVVVVAGHGAEAVAEAARAHSPGAVTVLQQPQLGTAHAVLAARDALAGFDGEAVVLYGDTPFVRPDTLRALIGARQAGGHALAVLGFEAADPGGYGRLIVAGDRLLRIVEAKDATPAELALRFCNSGVVAAGAATLFDLAAAVGTANAAGEYYLTDIVGIAAARGLTATAIACPEAETMGVNSRADLARAEALFQTRARAAAMAAGVTLTAPETVFLAHDTAIGRDTVIGPHVVFGPGVAIGEGVEILPFCHIEGCRVAAGARIGPFARLRPGAAIGAAARIGNFVEIKAADIGPGAAVGHLTYIGDAAIGAGANIGAGTVTCNYDGVSKHRTRIGAGAFVGSGAMLVAPVTLGDGALVAAGSTITQDVPADALAIARARQDTRPGMAARLRDRLRAMTLRKGG